MTLNRRTLFVGCTSMIVSLVVLGLALRSTASAAPPAQAPVTPTPAPTPLTATNLSNNPGDSDNPLLIFDRQGVLHLFWTDTSGRPQGSEVLHRQRSSAGTWSPTESLSADIEILFGDLRALLDAAGRVCIYYSGATVSNNPSTLGLYRRCQTATGWSAPEFVKATPGTHRVDYPVVAPDGSVKTMHLVGAGDLYFEDVLLSDDKLAYRPALIQDKQGGLHAVWTRQGDPFTLEYRYSNDGGKTWQAAQSLSDANTAPGGTVALATDDAGQDGARIHLVWVALGSKTYYRRWSAASGWTPTVELNGGAPNNSSTTLGLAVGPGGLAAVAWQAPGEIWYTEQQPDGTWTTPRVIAASAGGGTGPTLTIDANGVRHIVWRSPDPSGDLLYASLASIVSVNVPGSPLEVSPFFRQSIRDPSIFVSASPAVLATNFALALVLALAMGFFGNLLNDTLEANEERVARLLGPIRSVVTQLREFGRGWDERLARGGIAWLGKVVQLLFLLLVFGIIFAFVDPTFDLGRADAWLVILTLALSVGVISLIDDVLEYIYLKCSGEAGVLRLHAGNTALAVISLLFTRTFQITPGILVGSPAGLEQVQETQHEAYLHLIAMGATAGISLSAWFLAPFFTNSPLIATILLLLFAVGVQTLFFEMLPLRDLHGKSIFESNRLLWVMMVVLVSWLFITTMLNPDGAFLGAFIQPDMVGLAVVVAVFCLFSTGVWFYFNVGKKG